jgi:thioredoxin 2
VPLGLGPVVRSRSAILSVMAEPDRGHPSTKLNVLCPLCGSIVSVPSARLGDRPRCGRCKAEVLGGRPSAAVGKRLARHLERTELPVLLDAGAEWCQPCKRFEPEYERVAEALRGRAVCLTFDVDADQAMAARLGIQAVPTLFLFRGGREVARQSGASTARDVLAWFETQLAASGE